MRGASRGRREPPRATLRRGLADRVPLSGGSLRRAHSRRDHRRRRRASGRAADAGGDMRTLFVSQELPPETGWGGIGTYVDVLSEALARKSVEVHVLSVVEGQTA